MLTDSIVKLPPDIIQITIRNQSRIKLAERTHHSI